MPFIVPEDYSCFVLIQAPEDKPMTRSSFYFGTLYNSLQAGGHGKYEMVDFRTIDARLREFCADERVEGHNMEAIDELVRIRVGIDKVKEVRKVEKDSGNW